MGTEAEHMNRHLSLAKYLSYDEIMLGSLVGVSGPTDFINSGSRYNRAQRDMIDKHQPTGIFIVQFGARYERQDVMNSVHVLSHSRLVY